MSSRFRGRSDRSKSSEINDADFHMDTFSCNHRDFSNSLLESEWFYEHLDVIRRATDLVRNRYQDVYARFHQQRLDAYAAAIDEIKGLPEWAQVANWVESTDDPVLQEERKHRLNAVLSRLASKIYNGPLKS